VVLSDQAWKILYEIYGGTDVPRYSIEVASDTDDKDFIVEVLYQKLQVYILPKSANHLVLKRPSYVYISRKATVLDYHTKVAEILLPNQKEYTLDELLAISRLWRLDTGESAIDIEKDF
jgi:hypothetical protein